MVQTLQHRRPLTDCDINTAHVVPRRPLGVPCQKCPLQKNSPKLCLMQLQWEYAYLTDDEQYLSNDAIYRVVVNRPPIRNHPLRVLLSRDRWRHVTQNGDNITL